MEPLGFTSLSWHWPLPWPPPAVPTPRWLCPNLPVSLGTAVTEPAQAVPPLSPLCPPVIAQHRALGWGGPCRAALCPPLQSPSLPVSCPWQRGGPGGLQLHIPEPSPARPGAAHGARGSPCARRCAPAPAGCAFKTCSGLGWRKPGFGLAPRSPRSPPASLRPRPWSPCHRQCHPWVCVPRAAPPAWMAPGMVLRVAAALRRGLPPQTPLTSQD